jgi:hypothetical protein
VTTAVIVAVSPTVGFEGDTVIETFGEPWAILKLADELLGAQFELPP